MKIGFDGKRATHNFRGLGNYSRGIIEGLYTFAPENELFLYTPPFNDPRAINWTNHHPKLKIKTPRNLISKKIPSFWRSFLLEREIKRDEIDLYHGLSHEIPRVSSKRKYKVAVTIHDLIYLRYPEYFPKVDRVVFDKKFRYATQNSDVVIAICEQTKNDLIEFFKTDEKKIKVHYQSCSPVFLLKKSQEEKDLFRQNHHLERPYILNVGAFEERKNQKSAVLAFSQIANKFDVDLVLVGNGKKYLHEVKELIHSLKLESRIKILNNFPFHSLPILYQCAEIFFFPSHFEGFGIPIVEALCSSVPVACSKGSCFPESAGPDSLFFDSKNVDEMAQILNVLLNDNERRIDIARKGLLYSERFHLKNSTSELLKIYHQINP